MNIPIKAEMLVKCRRICGAMADKLKADNSDDSGTMVFTVEDDTLGILNIAFKVDRKSITLLSVQPAKGQN